MGSICHLFHFHVMLNKSVFLSVELHAHMLYQLNHAHVNTHGYTPSASQTHTQSQQYPKLSLSNPRKKKHEIFTNQRKSNTYPHRSNTNTIRPYPGKKSPFFEPKPKKIPTFQNQTQRRAQVMRLINVCFRKGLGFD